MALIKCPECGKEVSDKAKSCIHCGYPINVSKIKTNDEIIEQTKQKKKIGLIVFIILIILGIGIGVFSYNYSISGKKEANQAIEILKDYKSGVISSETAKTRLDSIANTLEIKAKEVDKFKAVNLNKISIIIHEVNVDLIYDSKSSIDTTIAKLEKYN